MKTYYYFLFRIYWHFRDVVKEGHKMSLISTSLVSAFMLYFSLITISGLIDYFKTSSSADLGFNYKFWILFFLFVIWFLNYYLFVKPRDFLRKNFKKDKKGGFIIVFIILLIGILFVIGANKNREKIVKEREEKMVIDLKVLMDRAQVNTCANL